MFDLTRFSREWLASSPESREVMLKWLEWQGQAGDLELPSPDPEKQKPTYHFSLAHSEFPKKPKKGLKILSCNVRVGHMDVIYYDLAKVAPFNAEGRIAAYYDAIARDHSGTGGKKGRYGVIRSETLANPRRLKKLLTFVGAALDQVRLADGRAPVGPFPDAEERELHAINDASPGKATVNRQREPGTEFDPATVEGDRQRRQASITNRQGQPAFRKAVLAAYRNCCAISGSTTVEVLEAAHITPYQGTETNDVTNGLLLRSDLHTLFDLGLLWIDSATLAVKLDAGLQGGEYWSFHGQSLRLPEDPRSWPSTLAFAWHARTYRRNLAPSPE